MKKGSSITDDRSKMHLAKHLRNDRHKKLFPSKFVLIVVVLIAIFLLFALLRPSDPLTGRWNMDEVTSYEFYSGGKGMLMLPTTEYEFSYTVSERVLNIDFTYEGAKDAQYSFTVEGDTLTLEGGSDTTQRTYTLYRDDG